MTIQACNLEEGHEDCEFFVIANGKNDHYKACVRPHRMPCIMKEDISSPLFDTEVPQGVVDSELTSVFNWFSERDKLDEVKYKIRPGGRNKDND